MSPDELREELELNIVLLLKDMMSRGKLTDARAQTISQYVLDLLTPGMTFEQLYQTVPKLDDSAPELAPVTTPIIQEYETRIVGQATDQVRNLIRQGQYDAAATPAKQAVNKEVKIQWSASAKP